MNTMTYKTMKPAAILGLLFHLLTALVPFGAGSAQAAEVPKWVELQKQVNQSIHDIIRTNRDSLEESQMLEEEIKRVVNQLRGTTDEAERYRLQKIYIDLRSRALLAKTEAIVKIEESLTGINKNLMALERYQQNSDRFGIGQGIRRDDPVARQAIQDTFRGYGNLIDMVGQLDPKAKMDNTRVSVATLEEVARQFFRGNDTASLREQQSFIKEALVATKAVQRFIGVERDYLMRKLYFVDARNMIKEFGRLKEAVFEGFDVATVFRGIHEQDDEVFSDLDDGSSAPVYGAHIDTSKFGEWD